MHRMKITTAQHDTLGAQLQQARDLLGPAACTTGLPSKLADKLAKAQQIVDQVRSEAEELLFRDHPDEATLDTYYRHTRA